MTKVYVIGREQGYEEMYRSRGWDIVDSVESSDLVQFTGGEDVSPMLYGEEAHWATHANSDRDQREMVIYNEAKRLEIPMVGICRGGQFLHVMNGGDLWQHVHNHAIGGTHEAIDQVSGIIVDVTSTHHQMMRMNDGNGVVVLKADTISPYKEKRTGGFIDSVRDEDDIEAVWYEDTRCFCFQPHPEFRGYAPCTNYFFMKVEELLGLSA